MWEALAEVEVEQYMESEMWSEPHISANRQTRNIKLDVHGYIYSLSVYLPHVGL